MPITPTVDVRVLEAPLVVPFVNRAGVTSMQSYSGPMAVAVSGTGQARGKQFSDAFYLYTDGIGRRACMQTDETSLHQCEDIPDCLLAERVLAGDQDAFAVLVRRYRPWLFSFICHLTHNGTEAEDILQHVFLKLYLSLPTLRINQPLQPWLFQVARNRCCDEMRRKRSWSFSELEEGVGVSEVSELALLFDTHPLPEEVAEQHEMQSVVQHAISTLPAKLRAIVLLRYAEQLSFAEIAQVLGIPEQTAKTYMHRAKPLLRVALRAQQHAHV